MTGLFKDGYGSEIEIISDGNYRKQQHGGANPREHRQWHLAIISGPRDEVKNGATACDKPHEIEQQFHAAIVYEKGSDG